VSIHAQANADSGRRRRTRRIRPPGPQERLPTAPRPYRARRRPRRRRRARLRLLPRLAHALQHTDRLRRWTRPNQAPVYDVPPTSADSSGNDDSPALVQDHSTPDDRPPLGTAAVAVATRGWPVAHGKIVEIDAIADPSVSPRSQQPTTTTSNRTASSPLEALRSVGFCQSHAGDGSPAVRMPRLLRAGRWQRPDDFQKLPVIETGQYLSHFAVSGEPASGAATASKASPTTSRPPRSSRRGDRQLPVSPGWASHAPTAIVVTPPPRSACPLAKAAQHPS
jgi:hypothetical protein